MLTTKGWHQRCGRNDCPYCSEPVFVAANARGRRARTSVNLAIKEQLEQSCAPEQPLLDQLLSAGCNATKEK